MFPLDKLAKLSPSLAKDLKKFFDQFSQTENIFTIPEGSTCSHTDLWVNKVRVKAVVDSGAPGNIISTKLMKKIKLALDIECNKKFGTAGKEVTTALGAYSALPLRIGSMQMSAPAIYKKAMVMISS